MNGGVGDQAGILRTKKVTNCISNNQSWAGHAPSLLKRTGVLLRWTGLQYVFCYFHRS